MLTHCCCCPVEAQLFISQLCNFSFNQKFIITFICAYSLYMYEPCYLFLKRELALKSQAQLLSFPCRSNYRKLLYWFNSQGFNFLQNKLINNNNNNKNHLAYLNSRIHQEFATHASQGTTVIKISFRYQVRFSNQKLLYISPHERLLSMTPPQLLIKNKLTLNPQCEEENTVGKYCCLLQTNQSTERFESAPEALQSANVLL